MHTPARSTRTTLLAGWCALGLTLLFTACAQPQVPDTQLTPPATIAPQPPSDEATPTPTVAPPTIGTPTVVTTGLQSPWSIAFAQQTALVSERDTGRIQEILGDGSLREVGTVPGIQHGGEGGLLGIAAGPTQAGGSDLFVYSTGFEGNRVQRFALAGAPGSFSLGESVTILSPLPSSTSHNGGRIAFGPDEMLYVAVGDAGDRAAAQQLETLSGKILRVTPEGGIPSDNPFSNSPVWSLGHRNVQGLTWGDDGTMFASEFGQDTWDELNVIVPGGNYGWPEVEGIAGAAQFVDPVQQWAPAEASPSGLTFARGVLFIANLRGSLLRTVDVASLHTAQQHFSGEYGRIRDAVVAPDGSVWIVTNNTDGRTAPREGDDRVLRIPLE